MHFAGDRSMKFKLIANKEGKKKEQEIVQKKFYNMEYSGILYRTHSYLNLLDLLHIKTSLGLE